MPHWLRTKVDQLSCRGGLVSAPSGVRELLLALGRHRGPLNVDAFLASFDFANVGPHQVYAAVLGRLPESAKVAVGGVDYDPRAHFRAALQSVEFQTDLIARTLRALPEYKHIVFVHVPKCAGIDLASHLAKRFPNLHRMDEELAHTSNEKLLSRLSTLIQTLSARREIAVMGHVSLDWLITNALLRFGDEVFSVVREPIEMAISQVNFVLTQHFQDPDRWYSPTRDWLASMGADRIPRDACGEELRRLAVQMLHDPQVVSPNTICRYLGRGDFDSALDLCAAADIELTTVTRYAKWLQTRWKVQHSLRVNESQKYLIASDLRPEDRERLIETHRDDLRFYERLDRRLTETGQLSLGGAAL